MRKNLTENLTPKDLQIIDRVKCLTAVQGKQLQWADGASAHALIQALREGGRHKAAHLLESASTKYHEEGARRLALIVRMGNDPVLSEKIHDILNSASANSPSIISPLPSASSNPPSPGRSRPNRANREKPLEQSELFPADIYSASPIETTPLPKPREHHVYTHPRQIELLTPLRSPIIHSALLGGPYTVSNTPVSSPWQSELRLEPNGELPQVEVRRSGNPGALSKRLGCKSALLPKLDRAGFLPRRQFKIIVDLFGGSFATSAYMAKTGRLTSQTHLISTEIHPHQFNIARATRMDVNGLIEWCRYFEKKHSDEFFVRMKDEYGQDQELESERDFVYAAARYIYLMAACINSDLRENRTTGHINVNSRARYGDGDKPIKIFDEVNLRMMNTILQNATLINGGYENFTYFIDASPEDTFVYMDPPYQDRPTTTEYGVPPFTDQDQANLAEIFLRLQNRGVYVAMSNSDTPLMCDLLKGAKNIRKIDVNDRWAASRQHDVANTKPRTHRTEIFATSY